MNKLLLEANRNGYSVEQCGQTITVGDLKDLLSDYDDEMKIYVSHDNGYTYGSVNITDFREYEEEEESEE